MGTPSDPNEQPLNPHWPAHMQPPPYTPSGDATPAHPQPPAGYQHPYSPQPYPPAYAVPLVRPTSGMATASLIFGIAGLFLFCLILPSLVAVLCGQVEVGNPGLTRPRPAEEPVERVELLLRSPNR